MPPARWPHGAPKQQQPQSVDTYMYFYGCSNVGHQPFSDPPMRLTSGIGQKAWATKTGPSGLHRFGCCPSDGPRGSSGNTGTCQDVPTFSSPVGPIFIPTFWNFIQLAFLSFSFATFRAFYAFGTFLVPHVRFHKSRFAFLAALSFSTFRACRTITTDMSCFPTTKASDLTDVHGRIPRCVFCRTFHIGPLPCRRRTLQGNSTLYSPPESSISYQYLWIQNH